MRNLEDQPVSVAETQRPTVAIDATKATPGDIARTTLRAKIRDHPVLVSHDRSATRESIRIADEAGALVLDTTDSSDETQSTLVRVAKTYGFSGLIWHDTPSEPIDYSRTIDDFETSEEYVVEAAIGAAAFEDCADQTEVLVAIPAYNEAETIGEVVSETAQFADRIVVVDDGSDDDTAERAEKAGATVVKHRRNQGYGGALKTAFEEADRLGVEHLVILDGDGQHDPADVPNLVETQRESGAEIVIGSRFEGDSDVPLYRRFGLFVINTLTNVGLGTIGHGSWIRDTQSGFRAYDTDAIRTIARDDAIGTQMSASTDIIHHALNRNYAIEEVGTRITYDSENSNSQHPLSHGVVLIRNILTLIEQERPIMLIGVPGFLAATVGFGLGYWALTNLFHTGDFPVGLAIASLFFILSGGLACFSAVILHSIEIHLG
ncbi:glycosyltransferase family 2 protein [Halorussus sp. MSC15.2]|uniref:glycosyltransferase family 2 protein n=1 Tax=Halorussus sp. MSC15.2 TaxID=2283638 RepID=UPI0013D31709|nr:glycosyltransferase family 2 protein [Halorussus sp. MSC15.2]NEU58101.1 glycosyltransferase family 2 protein [Halorussus sp. MSC15.2]